MNRAKPQRPRAPEEGEEAPLHGSEWLQRQMELTKQMSDDIDKTCSVLKPVNKSFR